MNKTRFIILANARTGSSAISEGLKTHPDIECIYEPCHPANIDVIDRKIKQIRDSASIYDLIYNNHNNVKPIVGCKHLMNHETAGWSNGFTQNLLNMYPDIKLIVMFRKNVVEQAISWRYATKTRRWWNRDAYQSHPKIKLDGVRKQIAIINKYNRRIRSIINARGSYLNIFYEDFVEDNDKIFAQCLEFLGASPMSIKSPLVPRQYQWEDVIINYEQIMMNVLK